MDKILTLDSLENDEASFTFFSLLVVASLKKYGKCSVRVEESGAIILTRGDSALWSDLNKMERAKAIQALANLHYSAEEIKEYLAYRDSSGQGGV